MKVVIAVTTDIYFDQRVQKLAGTFVQMAHPVTVVGRRTKNTPEKSLPIAGIWLSCWFHKSVWFYAEYNIRLFLYLCKHRPNLVWACDLDTLLACTLASKLFKLKLVFDAHEYFEESVEILHKPWIRKVWQTIAKLCIPKANACISVSQSLCAVLEKKYHKKFHLIRNVPKHNPLANTLNATMSKSKVLWYQGAVNEGRGLELVIRCLPNLPDYTLCIAGDGDLTASLQQLVKDMNLEGRVQFLGRLPYAQLVEHARDAFIGLDLLESRSKSYFHSLSNKTFDYMQAGLPMIQMNFPEYIEIHRTYKMGVLLNELNADLFCQAILQFEDPSFLQQCREACHRASKSYNWDQESIQLIQLVNNL